MKKQHDPVQTGDTADKVDDNTQHEDQWKDKYVRALADYQNLERRAQEEKEATRIFAAEVILSRLLPVVDTFGKAKEHLQDAGLDLAFRELEAVLKEQGVERIETTGRAFNPHEMECIEVVEGKDNEVIEEVVPGYRFRGKVLRVAHVKVGKHKGGS